jgi:hypothetical protein
LHEPKASLGHCASIPSRKHLDDPLGDRVGVFVEHEVAAVEKA